MKRNLFLPLFIVLLYSCNNAKKERPVNNLLVAANINSQMFTVDPGSDTLLRTSHGTILRIKKGSFPSPVSIELKEVFTPEEIFQSGITTTSDGRPLRSAGMLYFNATAGGKPINPQIPISTTIPKTSTVPDMQLFRGELTEDSIINWTQPQKLDTTLPEELRALISRGTTLFQQCQSCHKIFTDATGPALKGVEYRGSWRNIKNLVNYLKNPARYAMQDTYAQEISHFSAIAHPSFLLTEKDIRSILAYINSVTPGKEELADSTGYISSSGQEGDRDCGYDTSYSSIRNNFPEYDTSSFFSIMEESATSDTSDSYTHSGRDYSKEGYDFEIKENGWYNIDAFLKENNIDVENVKLTVDIKTQEDVFMNVYVFIPTERVLQSTWDRKENQYYFDFENGTIPLPLRHRAIIFAFGSIGDRILYGITEVTIQKEQLVSVSITETTSEGLKYLLQSKNINGVELAAVKKKTEISKRPCPDGKTGTAEMPERSQ
jgi:hypothetical protein